MKTMFLQKLSSKVDFTLKKLIIIGVLLEIIIFLLSYFLQPSIEDVFRYAARYSGRLSFFVFLFTFYLFAISYHKKEIQKTQLKNFIILFATLHCIHWCFLAMSVYSNQIALEVPKVIGGGIAYGMIISAPFLFFKLKPKFQLVYFYYVSLVMALTYVARIKGDFPGVTPNWYHYFGLIVMIICCIVFGIWIKKKKAK